MLTAFARLVKAQAIVDVAGFEPRDRVHGQAFLVTCFGELEGGEPLPRRSYEIEAGEDSAAAFAGLERYVHEMDRSLN